MHTPIEGWCVWMRADTDEYKEKNKKEHTHWADGRHGVQMHCMQTPMRVKKKKEKKKNILK